MRVSRKRLFVHHRLPYFLHDLSIVEVVLALIGSRRCLAPIAFIDLSIIGSRRSLLGDTAYSHDTGCDRCRYPFQMHLVLLSILPVQRHPFSLLPILSSPCRPGWLVFLPAFTLMILLAWPAPVF